MNTVKLTNFIAVMFGLFSVPYAIFVTVAGFYFLSAVLVIYIASMAAILFINFFGHHKTAKFLCLIYTNIMIYLFGIILGSESGVHWILISTVITPSILFSYKNKVELFLSIICQIIPVAAFFIYNSNYHIASYSISNTTGMYLQNGSIIILIAALATQILYLVYTVNKNEQRLRQAMAEITTYKNALDSVAIVAFTDKAGNITEVNENFCNISGYQRHELIGKNHRILKSGLHTEKLYENLWQTISSGKIWREEMCNTTKDGKIYWVDTSIVPNMDENGNVDKYFSIRFDITDKKIAEEQLQNSAKMSSLGEMASGVAHEINTPLTVIQLKIDQLSDLLADQDSMSSAEKAQKVIEDIDATVKRISKIIQGLRVFARDSKNDSMVNYPVNNIVQETLDLCHERMKQKGITVDFTHTKEVKIMCRPTEISQVLLNLLNNSVDAIENLSERWIKINIDVLAGKLELSVIDSGKGLSKEINAKIMQPFFTTKEVGKGTGLGLSISRGIVKSHSGDLFTDSYCENTKFVIRLPCQS